MGSGPQLKRFAWRTRIESYGFLGFLYHVMSPQTEPCTVTSKIDSLNGLRGLAILMVIFHHSLSSFFFNHLHISQLVNNGWMGVNLFFMLSGFVLYRPFYLRRRHFDTWADVGWFYKHRFLRLYPLLILHLLLALLVAGEITTGRVVSLFLALTGLSQFTAFDFFPVISVVLWSLSLEIWFSLMFPALVLLIRNAGFWRTCIGAFMVALTIRYLGADWKWVHVYLNPLKDSLLGRLDDFVLGMILLRLYYENDHFRRWNTLLVLLLSASGLLLGCHLWDKRALGELHWAYIPFLTYLLHLGFGGLIVSCLQPESLMQRLFSIRPLQLLGLMCYSIYLWHCLFNMRFNLPCLSFSANWLLFVIATFTTSAITYRYIEFGAERDWRKLFLLH